MNQLEIFRVFERFVIDVGRCIRASTREHIERYPKTDFVFSPRVPVRPVDQLVPDPREETDR